MTTENTKICPICFEHNGIQLILSCNHCIHLGCAEGLVNFLCPYCRSEITNWPAYLKKIIKNNKEKRDKELQEELERENQQYIDSQYVDYRQFMFVRTNVGGFMIEL